MDFDTSKSSVFFIEKCAKIKVVSELILTPFSCLKIEVTATWLAVKVFWLHINSK